MYRIALNVSISFLRKNTRPGRQSVPLDELKHESMQQESSSPETEERIATLQRLIGQCQPLHRALLLLYLDNCAYREIAAVPGLTETNVATKLSRLKEHLRQKLTAND
jgi:DNA-directed RNA polymerase specialized sigma24 family protein